MTTSASFYLLGDELAGGVFKGGRVLVRLGCGVFSSQGPRSRDGGVMSDWTR